MQHKHLYTVIGITNVKNKLNKLAIEYLRIRLPKMIRITIYYYLLCHRSQYRLKGFFFF